MKQTPAYPEDLTRPALVAGLLGAYRGFRMTFGDERRLRHTQRVVRGSVGKGQKLQIEVAGGARKARTAG